jgi:hypothetical protein
MNKLTKMITMIVFTMLLSACNDNEEIKEINNAYIKGVPLPIIYSENVITRDSLPIPENKLKSEEDKKGLYILIAGDNDYCNQTLTFQLNKNNQVYWEKIIVSQYETAKQATLSQENFSLYNISDYCNVGENTISLSISKKYKENNKYGTEFKNIEINTEEAAYIHEVHNTFLANGEYLNREINKFGREFRITYMSELETRENVKDLLVNYGSVPKGLCKLILNSNVVNTNINYKATSLANNVSSWTYVSLNGNKLTSRYAYNLDNICGESNKISFYMSKDD